MFRKCLDKNERERSREEIRIRNPDSMTCERQKRDHMSEIPLL